MKIGWMSRRYVGLWLVAPVAAGAAFWASTVPTTRHPMAAERPVNRTRRRWFRKRNVCMAASGLVGQSCVSPVILKPVGNLQNQLVGRLGRVGAVDKLVVAFEEQGARDIIDATDGVAFGGVSQSVMQRVVAAHEFRIVDARQFQIQTRQFVTRLHKPAVLIDGSKVVAAEAAH